MKKLSALACERIFKTFYVVTITVTNFFEKFLNMFSGNCYFATKNISFIIDMLQNMLRNILRKEFPTLFRKEFSVKLRILY